MGNIGIINSSDKQNTNQLPQNQPSPSNRQTGSMSNRTITVPVTQNTNQPLHIRRSIMETERIRFVNLKTRTVGNFEYNKFIKDTLKDIMEVGQESDSFVKKKALVPSNKKCDKINKNFIMFKENKHFSEDKFKEVIKKKVDEMSEDKVRMLELGIRCGTIDRKLDSSILEAIRKKGQRKSEAGKNILKEAEQKKETDEKEKPELKNDPSIEEQEKPKIEQTHQKHNQMNSRAIRKKGQRKSEAGKNILKEAEQKEETDEKEKPELKNDPSIEEQEKPKIEQTHQKDEENVKSGQTISLAEKYTEEAVGSMLCDQESKTKITSVIQRILSNNKDFTQTIEISTSLIKCKWNENYQMILPIPHENDGESRREKAWLAASNFINVIDTLAKSISNSNKELTISICDEVEVIEYRAGGFSMIDDYSNEIIKDKIVTLLFSGGRIKVTFTVRDKW